MKFLYKRKKGKEGKSSTSSVHVMLNFWIITPVITLLVSELSTSMRAFQYDLKPGFPEGEGGRLFFDTHAVVQLFEENGLAAFVTYKMFTKLLCFVKNELLIFLYKFPINRLHNSAS